MKHRKLTEEKSQALSRLRDIMLRHIGPNKRIGMGELYQEVFGRPWNNRINDTRELRHLITLMRNEGHVVVSMSSRTGGGYYMSTCDSEIETYCNKEKKRALKILTRISRMENTSLPEYLGQMKNELEVRHETHAG